MTTEQNQSAHDVIRGLLRAVPRCHYGDQPATAVATDVLGEPAYACDGKCMRDEECRARLARAWPADDVKSLPHADAIRAARVFLGEAE